MYANHRIGVGRGALAAGVSLAVLLAVAIQALVGQEREREPGVDAPRDGGIPRRALGTERERDRQEGTEEGMPDAGARARMKEYAPRIAPPRGDWKLGVWVYNTDTGVVITRVERGSPAERRGLEPGDRIVSVGGYQIGYVGDYLYPLGYELQRQVDRRGNVLLLVQNVRNSELASFEVRLDGGGRIRPLPAGDRREDSATPRQPSAPARPDR